MLVSPHDRAVDHRVFVVGIGRQSLEQPLPHSFIGPAGKAHMDLYGIAKALRQIAPGNACAIAVEHGLDKQPVVLGGHSDMTGTSR